MIRHLALSAPVLGVAVVFAQGATVQPVKRAPLDYFAARCARCHGVEGSMYSPTLAKLKDSDLRRIVSEMAVGPAGDAISGRDLDAQVAFHRSLILREPFMAVTSLSIGTLRGEASGGSTVSAVAGTRRLAVLRSGRSWRIALPKGVQPQQVTLSARLGKATAHLDLSSSAFTHSAPIRAGN